MHAADAERQRQRVTDRADQQVAQQRTERPPQQLHEATTECTGGRTQVAVGDERGASRLHDGLRQHEQQHGQPDRQMRRAVRLRFQHGPGVDPVHRVEGHADQRRHRRVGHDRPQHQAEHAAVFDNAALKQVAETQHAAGAPAADQHAVEERRQQQGQQQAEDRRATDPAGIVAPRRDGVAEHQRAELRSPCLRMHRMVEQPAQAAPQRQADHRGRQQQQQRPQQQQAPLHGSQRGAHGGAKVHPTRSTFVHHHSDPTKA